MTPDGGSVRVSERARDLVALWGAAKARPELPDDALTMRADLCDLLRESVKALEAECERLTNLARGQEDRALHGDMAYAEHASQREQIAALAAHVERLRDALEDITSTAREVKASNTPEFMRHIQKRVERAEEAWDAATATPTASLESAREDRRRLAEEIAVRVAKDTADQFGGSYADLGETASEADEWVKRIASRVLAAHEGRTP